MSVSTPYDFYVFDEWRLGNLNEHSFFELQNSEAGQK